MDSLFYRKEKKRLTLRERLLKLLKNSRFIVGFLLAAGIAVYVLFGDYGVVQHIRLRIEKARLEEKVRQAEEETRRLQAQSRALESDPRAIERVAREQHGMIREGETVYKVTKK